LDLGSETELRIQIKELLFDDAYLSKVIDDKKSWFTRMEVLDLIYHQFFFTANSLGRQPTTSQFFQPLTPQTLALVAAAIHCALSEYATGKKVTVMFSQDEYRGKFCPSTVTDCISAEAIALIKFKLHMVGLLHTPPPQWCSSAIIGAPQSPSALLNPSALLSLDWCCDISFSTPYCLFCPRSSIPSSTSIRSASISFQTLYFPPLSALLSMDGLLRCIGAPQSPSALLGLDLRPSISFCITISTPLDHLTRHQALLFFSRIHHIAFQTPF
jgi:hypothetical protein